MQRIRTVVQRHLIVLAVQRELALGDAVGEAPDRGAEILRLAQVAGCIRVAQHHVGHLAVAVGQQQGLQAGAEVDHPRGDAVVIAQGDRLDRAAALGLLLTTSVIAQSMSMGSPTMLGFSDASSQKQRALESKFDSYLKADNLRMWMKRLSARPHHLGSPYDKENAEFIASQFKSWGYDTQIEQFDVLFPTPKTRLVEMTSPEKFTLKLNEPKVEGDATSGQQNEQLPTYNAYSIDGDVNGPLVYVNYGRPSDYEELARRGVDVKGKIVISRYGGAWRGIKPKVAAEHGAIGCLIYSDPRNDGYYQGDVYPKGAFRNENGVQRGSVMDMPLYPGDPLTKGIGATKDAKRIDIKNAETLTKIPVLPISYSDALPLLKNLDGAVVPDSWRGALPMTYHFGGKTPTVRMKVEFNWDTKTIYDVIAKMPGSERPDEWIIRGNHHDAWVNGANDPLSGQVAMMEEARAMSELAKTGWRPKRTIVFCCVGRRRRRFDRFDRMGRNTRRRTEP